MLARRSPLVAALVFAFTVPSPRAGADPVDYAPLESVVRAEMKAAGVPGVVVIVVRGDRIDYAKGFGVAGVETNDPVTPDHLFRIGSTTKMFVGAAAASLAHRGKLDLNKPVGEVVGGLPSPLAAVTPHQLLTHTAGLADEAPMFGKHDETELGAGIASWKTSRLFTTPGDIYSYSNPGYWLAGYAVERAAGRPFAEVLDEDMFRPLGMKRSTFRPTMAMTYPLAHGHEARDGTTVIIRPPANNAATWPAGSLYSSGNDLARFVIALLNGGQLDGKEAIPVSVVEEITKSHVTLPGDRGSYGYGLAIRPIRGVPTWSHGGSRSGYGSHIAMAPVQKYGIIVLANRSGAGMPKTVAKAAELLLPLGPARAATKAADPTPDELRGYAGAYRNGATAVTLKWDEDRLVQIVAGNARDLRGVGGSKFRTSTGELLDVVRGRDGTTQYLFVGNRALKRQTEP
jgi:CubicO group peptidase (beta-lactamase class C family)